MWKSNGRGAVSPSLDCLFLVKNWPPSWWNMTWRLMGRGLTACHNYPPGPVSPGLVVVEKLLWKLCLRLYPIKSVTEREETTWLILYRPISSAAWQGKTARRSSRRLSVSGFGLCLSLSLCLYPLIVTCLAARHDSAVSEVWRCTEQQIQWLQTARHQFRRGLKSS